MCFVLCFYIRCAAVTSKQSFLDVFVKSTLLHKILYIILPNNALKKVSTLANKLRFLPSHLKEDRIWDEAKTKKLAEILKENINVECKNVLKIYWANTDFFNIDQLEVFKIIY